MKRLLRRATFLALAWLTAVTVVAASVTMAWATPLHPGEAHCSACDQVPNALAAIGSCGVACVSAVITAPECSVVEGLSAGEVSTLSRDRVTWGRSVRPDPFPPRNST